MDTDRGWLLDTSIQVKRLISLKWREGKLDSLWRTHRPVTCVYSFMEFKNSVIGALRYLRNVIADIGAAKGGRDTAKTRLEEVLAYLTIDSNHPEGDRRVRLAIAYATQLLRENSYYPAERPVSQLIDQITLEAENLEKIWFFHYVSEGQTKKMEVVDKTQCHLGRNSSPMAEDGSLYTCRKGELECEISSFIYNNQVQGCISSIVTRTVSVRSTRLRQGAEHLHERLQNSTLHPGVSIGQTLCFPIGDCIITCQAAACALGLLTGDRDQLTLGKHVGLRCLHYDMTVNDIIPG